ncbi:MAG: DNRLRE domain-containing protein [Kiritimatiellia bacterium]
MKTPSLLFTLGAVLFLSIPSRGTLLVDWGGPYVSADQPTQRGMDGVAYNFYSLVDLSKVTGVHSLSRKFDTSLALNPAIGSAYNGTNAAFYGGIGLSRINSGSPTAGTNTIFAGVINTGNADRIRMQITSPDNNQKAIGAQVFFRKDSFLNGGDALALSLNQSASTHISKFSMNINALSAFNVRFAVGTSDGKFYVANQALGIGSNVMDSAAIAATTFTEMRVVNGTYQGMGGSFLSTVASSTLTNISAVGFVGYNANTGFGTLAADLQVDSFEVTAVTPGVVGEVVLPNVAGVVNVKTAHGAVGNGSTDDTAALQAALDAAINTDKILYFPNGTYRLTNTLTWNGNSKRVTLQGQSQSGVILKLDNNAAGFGSTTTFKPVLNLSTATSTGQAFRNQIFDLTVDVGSGNPGAIGVRFISNNQGGMRNVTIRSSDPAGVGRSGLDLSQQWPGPSLYRNLTIIGFNYGIFSKNREYSHVFETLTLIDQLIYGIYNKDQILTIRDLVYDNAYDKPAIYNTSESSNTWGMITLLDADLTNRSSGGSAKAIINNAGTLYCRNVVSTGFSALITNSDSSGTKTGVSASSVSEYSSHSVTSLFGTPTGSLNLPIAEAPFYNDTNLANWVGVSGFTSSAIQNAINACTSTMNTVYLPAGTYSIQSPITISGNVRRIIGLGATLSVDGSLRTSSGNVFTFGAMAHSHPVIFENFWTNFEGGPFTFFYNNSANPVVIRDVTLNNLGGGGFAYQNSSAATTLFIDDVLAYKGWKFNGKNIWARQFNVESYNEGASDANILNTGATLWVLGLKTEKSATILNNTAGGQTEILGGLGYPSVTVPDDRVAFINNESSMSVIFGFSNYTGGGSYLTAVKETSGGSTLTLANTDFPSRTYGGAFVIPLYSSGNSDSPTVNLAVSADSYVRESSPTGNFGTETSLLVKHSTSSTYHRRSFLKVPLGSLGADVSKAELVVTVLGIGGESVTNRPVRLVQVSNDSWTETGITWTNQPALGATLAEFTVTAADLDTEIAIDVTSYVNAQRTGDGTAGFALVQPDGGNALVTFHAREGSAAPKLEVTVSASALPVSADSYVRESSPTGNFGTETSLLVKHSTSSTYHRRSFLKVPLGSLGADVSKAELVVTVLGIGGESVTNRPVRLVQVSNDSWTETGITWTNQPALGATLAEFTLTAADLDTEIAIDVTSYVNAQRAGDETAGFALVQPDGGNALVTFHSREGSAPPKLEITP